MTTTYATTNIVIDAVTGWVWCEDFDHDTYPGVAENQFNSRAAMFLDGAHMRAFDTMATFSEFLHDRRAIVDECHILGAELSDEERTAPKATE